MTSSDIWSRIDRYRNATDKTLSAVAADLGIGVSMLMMVKSGARSLSGKAEYKLECAEIAAGLREPGPKLGHTDVVREERATYGSGKIRISALQSTVAAITRDLTQLAASLATVQHDLETLAKEQDEI